MEITKRTIHPINACPKCGKRGALVAEVDGQVTLSYHCENCDYREKQL